jgi:hypothetical protein
MKFWVDPWDPSYGTANDLDPAEVSKAQIDPDIEVPPAQWAPRRPVSAPLAERIARGSGGVPRIVFVDGVRRVEAHVWIDSDDGTPHQGTCASYAAGAVRCDGVATCGPMIVRRGLFTSYGAAEGIPTSAGEFALRVAPSPSPDGLALALQEQMGEAELAAAEAACAAGDVDVVVLDGPLRGRQHLTGAVGYVKTHHVTYLAPELNAVVGRLGPGERSPLFALGTTWSRISWYFRLPGPGSSPWSGIVRGECSAAMTAATAAALADMVTDALPRFASAPHKDSRAPQNLYPIAGLERELRHRLGDPQVLYRALRVAAAT